MLFPGRMHLRNGPIRPMTNIKHDSNKENLIYEIPHDNTEGDIFPITQYELDSLKNTKITISQAIRTALVLMKTKKLPSEIVSDILQFSGLYATFSIQTNETKIIGHIMVKYEKSNICYEYLSLSIPPLQG